MAVLCEHHTKPGLTEFEFCRALLNNENPVWVDNSVTKVRKKGCRLPPVDFVYGLKHPKSNGITGVAAALQYYDSPNDKVKPKIVPNFIAINKIATRLKLTKVQDIHQYRKTIGNEQMNLNSCICACPKKQLIPDIIHGRTTGERQSIRDVIENKYLHEWLHETAVRRCKEIMTNHTPKMKKTASIK